MPFPWCCNQCSVSILKGAVHVHTTSDDNTYENETTQMQITYAGSPAGVTCNYYLLLKKYINGQWDSQKKEIY